MLELKNGAFYTGITNDVSARIKKHKEGKGSKYVRAHLPLCLVYVEEIGSRTDAARREREIKKLGHKKKLALVLTQNLRRKKMTNKETPFPIEPILDRIIILKDEAGKEGNFLVPDSVKGRSKTGTVVAVGPGRINLENGEHLPLAVKVGDRVWLKEYDGYRFDVNGVTYSVFTENEIIGKVVGDV